MDATPIEVQNVYKRYGQVEALRGLSFTVRRGEIYGLLGPNGAGKTTTLKLLVGLLRPDSGRVRIHGYDVWRQRLDALRHVGYVPENPVGFQNLTVREFITYVAELRGVPREAAMERMNRLLSAFRLREKEDELFKTLSRGMAQKVLVIAALVPEPDVLVMDEPMAGMDPEAQHVFKEEVRRRAARGAAVLISSHLLDMVEKFCTRIGIISQGRLVAEGTLDELRDMVASGEHASLEEVFLRITGE